MTASGGDSFAPRSRFAGEGIGRIGLMSPIPPHPQPRAPEYRGEGSQGFDPR
jgi:hypothetical protein